MEAKSSVEVKWVTAPSDGVAPALLLTVKGGRANVTPVQYLVNVPEGFSRLVLEHRCRPGPGLRVALLTDLSQAALGGLAGLLLRLRQDGHAALRLVGPAGVRDAVDGLSHFVRWTHPALELSSLTAADQGCAYEDECIEVRPLWASCLLWQVPSWLAQAAEAGAGAKAAEAEGGAGAKTATADAERPPAKDGAGSEAGAGEQRRQQRSTEEDGGAGGDAGAAGRPGAEEAAAAAEEVGGADGEGDVTAADSGADEPGADQAREAGATKHRAKRARLSVVEADDAGGRKGPNRGFGPDDAAPAGADPLAALRSAFAKTSAAAAAAWKTRRTPNGGSTRSGAARASAPTASAPVAGGPGAAEPRTGASDSEPGAWESGGSSSSGTDAEEGGNGGVAAGAGKGTVKAGSAGADGAAESGDSSGGGSSSDESEESEQSQERSGHDKASGSGSDSSDSDSDSSSSSSESSGDASSDSSGDAAPNAKRKRGQQGANTTAASAPPARPPGDLFSELDALFASNAGAGGVRGAFGLPGRALSGGPRAATRGRGVGSGGRGPAGLGRMAVLGAGGGTRAGGGTGVDAALRSAVLAKLQTAPEQKPQAAPQLKKPTADARSKERQAQGAVPARITGATRAAGGAGGPGGLSGARTSTPAAASGTAAAAAAAARPVVQPPLGYLLYLKPTRQALLLAAPRDAPAADALAAHPAVQLLAAAAPTGLLMAVAHLTPAAVARRASYRRWVRALRGPHVWCGQDAGSAAAGTIAGAREKGGRSGSAGGASGGGNGSERRDVSSGGAGAAGGDAIHAGSDEVGLGQDAAEASTSPAQAVDCTAVTGGPSGERLAARAILPAVAPAAASCLLGLGHLAAGRVSARLNALAPGLFPLPFVLRRRRPGVDPGAKSADAGASGGAGGDPAASGAAAKPADGGAKGDGGSIADVVAAVAGGGVGNGANGARGTPATNRSSDGVRGQGAAAPVAAATGSGGPARLPRHLQASLLSTLTAVATATASGGVASAAAAATASGKRSSSRKKRGAAGAEAGAAGGGEPWRPVTAAVRWTDGLADWGVAAAGGAGDRSGGVRQERKQAGDADGGAGAADGAATACGQPAAASDPVAAVQSELLREKRGSGLGQMLEALRAACPDLTRASEAYRLLRPPPLPAKADTQRAGNAPAADPDSAAAASDRQVPGHQSLADAVRGTGPAGPAPAAAAAHFPEVQPPQPHAWDPWQSSSAASASASTWPDHRLVGAQWQREAQQAYAPMSVQAGADAAAAAELAAAAAAYGTAERRGRLMRPTYAAGAGPVAGPSHAWPGQDNGQAVTAPHPAPAYGYPGGPHPAFAGAPSGGHQGHGPYGGHGVNGWQGPGSQDHSRGWPWPPPQPAPPSEPYPGPHTAPHSQYPPHPQSAQAPLPPAQQLQWPGGPPALPTGVAARASAEAAQGAASAAAGAAEPGSGADASTSASNRDIAARLRQALRPVAVAAADSRTAGEVAKGACEVQPAADAAGGAAAHGDDSGPASPGGAAATGSVADNWEVARRVRIRLQAPLTATAATSAAASAAAKEPAAAQSAGRAGRSRREGEPATRAAARSVADAGPAVESFHAAADGGPAEGGAQQATEQAPVTLVEADAKAEANAGGVGAAGAGTEGGSGSLDQRDGVAKGGQEGLGATGNWEVAARLRAALRRSGAGAVDGLPPDSTNQPRTTIAPRANATAAAAANRTPGDATTQPTGSHAGINATAAVGSADGLSASAAARLATYTAELAAYSAETASILTDTAAANANVTAAAAPPVGGDRSSNPTHAPPAPPHLPRHTSLLFLGTGSAEPSKYRGGSGVLLRGLGPTRGSLLIDAGEGAFGALLRWLGPKGAVAEVAALSLVWLSHKHPDHVLGLPGLLEARHPACPPLLVVGPQEVASWLARLAPLHPSWRFTFLHCADFVGETPAVGAAVGPAPQATTQPGADWPAPWPGCTCCPPYAGASPATGPGEADPLFAPPPGFPFASSQSRRTSSYVPAASARLRGHQQRRAPGVQPPAPPPPAPQGPAAQPPWPPAHQRAAHAPGSQAPQRQQQQQAQRGQQWCRQAGLAAAAAVCASLGLVRWQSVGVHHCRDAWGLVLAAAEGWKLVYSGDTRPCPALISAGRGATLLVHEATFEPCLELQARRKRHCTSAEAAQVAEAMGAYRTVLTHFSQRYPHLPAGLDPWVTPPHRRPLPAFDGLLLPLAALPALPLLLPPLAEALGAAETEEAEAGAGEAGELGEEAAGAP